MIFKILDFGAFSPTVVKWVGLGGTKRGNPRFGVKTIVSCMIPVGFLSFPQFCFICHPKTFGLVLDLLYSFWGQKKGVVAMLEKWDYIP